LKCDGRRAENRIGPSAKRTIPLNLRGSQFIQLLQPRTLHQLTAIVLSLSSTLITAW